MHPHSVQRKHIGSPPPRSGMLSAALLLAAAVAALRVGVRAADGSAARGSAAPAPVLMLSDIPSHNRTYRASMIPSPGTIERNRPHVWTLVVRTAAGAPVEGAALALESWMPDDDRVAATRPRATAYLGHGRYRIEGLRFDRRGWWNVRLRISAASGTDSLAFNLIL